MSGKSIYEKTLESLTDSIYQCVEGIKGCANSPFTKEEMETRLMILANLITAYEKYSICDGVK